MEDLLNFLPNDTIDIVGASIYLEVQLVNQSKSHVFPVVAINAVISDKNGGSIFIKETITDFEPGILNHTFSTAYTVQNVPEYTITVYINRVDNYPLNDTTRVTRKTRSDEDIALLAFLNPVPDANAIDNVGDAVYLEVEIENKSLYRTYDYVALGAYTTANGVNSQIINVFIPDLEPGKINYTFTNSYTVPAASDYTITVFVHKIDMNQTNDTIISIVRKTNVGISDYKNTGFVLGQNIPNPAKENTRIEYGVPEDGQIVLTGDSVIGQVLHTEKRDAHSGRNRIEYNTANLANSFYFYSMEYKGERLVKKMMK
jgi:hypothetical protein